MQMQTSSQIIHKSLVGTIKRERRILYQMGACTEREREHALSQAFLKKATAVCRVLATSKKAKSVDLSSTEEHAQYHFLLFGSYKNFANRCTHPPLHQSIGIKFITNCNFCR